MGKTQLARIARIFMVAALAGILALSMTGCDNPTASSTSYKASESSVYDDSGWSAISFIDQDDSRLMSYDSYMGVKTDDVSAAELAFIDMVNDMGGQIQSASMDLDEEEGTGHANVVCWIPNGEFVNLTNEVRALGKVYTEDIDVTTVPEDIPTNPDDPLNIYDESSNDGFYSSERGHYSHYSGRDVTTTSELAVRFVDDTPNMFQLGGLATMFGMSVTGVIYFLVAMLPLALLVVLIIVIACVVSKRREKTKKMKELMNQMQAQGTTGASSAYSPTGYQAQASAPQPPSPYLVHPQYVAPVSPQPAAQPAQAPSASESAVPQSEPVIQIQPVKPAVSVTKKIEEVVEVETEKTPE